MTTTTPTTSAGTMLNKDVFADDVSRNQLRNQGVAKIGRPTTAQEWDNLDFELTSFVPDGAYGDGIGRVLGSFLDNAGRDQPAVWVSGFYGSGKSHFARVLEFLWRNDAFPDGQRARDKVKLPQAIRDQLIELDTLGRREGGLWAASGLLSAQASKDAGSDAVRLATLGLVFKAAGLPAQISRARFTLWLHRHDRYDVVRDRLAERGYDLVEEIDDLHVAEALPEVIADLVPSYGDAAGARAAILASFPANVTDISNDDFIDALDQTLAIVGTGGKRPVTLIVFDELQQFIGDDAGKSFAIQEIVEAVTARFSGRVLFLATGQSAMNETPNLQKLQGRFAVRVTLQETDVEHVVREVILRKDQTKVPRLKDVLDRASGEIDRQLVGTRIAPAHADRDTLIADYPLLPTRRRFWERLLRDIDTGGRAGQLRTQLRIVQDTNRAVALRPLGTVIGADAIYGQVAADMQAAGILPPDVNALIAGLDREPVDGDLKGRVARLVFLIGRLGTEGPLASGLSATSEIIGDLLVEDLTDSDSSIRRRLGPVLESLVERGSLQLVDGQYQIQTAEGREWDVAYSSRTAGLRNDPGRIRDERDARIRTRVTALLGKLRVRQGDSRTERDVRLHYGAEPPASGPGIPVWVRDEWTVPLKTVLDDARRAGQDSEVVFVHIPNASADGLGEAIVKAIAAQETIYARQGKQSTANGEQAQAAMVSRQKINEAAIERIITEVVAGAAVFQGGGTRAQRGTLLDSVTDAVEAGVSRLYTRFTSADNPNWEKVYERAVQGVPDALKAVGWDGDPEKQPVLVEVLKALGGNGLTGNEVRKRFDEPPYGWPKRTAEAALVVLVGAGRVEAKLNGVEQPSKGLTSQKLGPVRFTTEAEPLSKLDWIGLRGLVQTFDAKIPGTVSDEEVRVHVRQLLQRAPQEAQAAGGPAPAPAAPSAELFAEFAQLTGNAQLKAIHAERTQIIAQLKAWQDARKLLGQRLPEWERLTHLLAHATALPSLDAARAQAEAIRAQRTLLATPDPVAPLLTATAEALRKALRTAHADTSAALKRELETIESTPEWTQLPDERWRQIFRDQGLGPVAEPPVGTDLELLRTLDHAPLESWVTRRQAYPTKVKLAYQVAYRILNPTPPPPKPPIVTQPGPNPPPPPEPITVSFSPSHRVMATEADLDAWLADQRARIVKLLAEGKRVAV